MLFQPVDAAEDSSQNMFLLLLGSNSNTAGWYSDALFQSELVVKS